RDTPHALFRRPARRAAKPRLPAGRHPWCWPRHPWGAQAKGWRYLFRDRRCRNPELQEGATGESRIEAQIVYIPGNYVTDGLLRLLAANGFNFDLPSYVIWEGNTMYLNRPEVLKVLTDLRKKVVKFAISFDYLTEAVINYATGDERSSAFAKHFAEMDAPWT